MKRREFLKTGLIGAMGAALLPSVHNAATLQNDNPPDLHSFSNNELNFCWIGHSTVYINFFGTKIVTDPVFFERVGIYLFGYTYGPGRLTPPAVTLAQLPKPDMVLLSHAHMDHMDYRTLYELTELYPDVLDCVTAYNTKDVIADLPWRSLAELDWGENMAIHDIAITALEVKHFGWRFPWERDRSRGFHDNGRSFNAYILVKNGVRVLFGGDVALSDHFEKSGQQVDVALMPVGAYNPWRVNHCTPEEAVLMAKALNAKVFIPMHTKTFRQGMEPFEEPINRTVAACAEAQLQLPITTIGDVYKFA